MSVHLTINIRGEIPTLLRDEHLEQVRANVGNDVSALIKDNFLKRSQQTQSRRYWAQAMESTQVVKDGTETRIVIDHIGVRLHWKGGTVRPSGRVSEVTGKPIKSLLIPGEDSPLRQRSRSLAEAGINKDDVCVLQSEKGTPYLAWIKKSPKGRKSTVIPLGLLVKQTKHPADETVLPTQDAMEATAHGTALKTINNILENPTP